VIKNIEFPYKRYGLQQQVAIRAYLILWQTYGKRNAKRGIFGIISGKRCQIIFFAININIQVEVH